MHKEQLWYDAGRWQSCGIGTHCATCCTNACTLAHPSIVPHMNTLKSAGYQQVAVTRVTMHGPCWLDTHCSECPWKLTRLTAAHAAAACASDSHELQVLTKGCLLFPVCRAGPVLCRWRVHRRCTLQLLHHTCVLTIANDDSCAGSRTVAAQVLST